MKSRPVPPEPSPERTGTRSRFALTGPSVRLDPSTHAVRRDLADVRLAAQVFAPHYAAPALHVLLRSAFLSAARTENSATLARLKSGDTFEVFEFAGGYAWGLAPGCGLVGYLDAAALAPA
ncbi:SH3 domain-containing protein [uncultured Sphingomonas sp.]|uniref:SH3 domain-containing protein n=1 Tax=uncultured Sphingomonas sp. TaxID=158754 RepID=UPI0035CC5F25